MSLSNRLCSVACRLASSASSCGSVRASPALSAVSFQRSLSAAAANTTTTTTTQGLRPSLPSQPALRKPEQQASWVDLLKNSWRDFNHFNGSFAARVTKDAPRGMLKINRETDILSFSTFVARCPNLSNAAAKSTATAATMAPAPSAAYDLYPALGFRAMSSASASNDGKKYMVCLDGSENAERALEIAARLMKPQSGDKLYVVTIPPTIDVNPSLGADFIEVLRKDRDESAQKLVDDAANMFPTLKSSIVKVVGTPAGGPREQILELADTHKIDFIVLGSRGMGTVKRLLLGSVSNYVVNHAHCNVLVVK